MAQFIRGVPWVPETFLARFPVSVKSLQRPARKASPLVASAYGQHIKFPPHARKTSGTQVIRGASTERYYNSVVQKHSRPPHEAHSEMVSNWHRCWMWKPQLQVELLEFCHIHGTDNPKYLQKQKMKKTEKRLVMPYFLFLPHPYPPRPPPPPPTITTTTP